MDGEVLEDDPTSLVNTVLDGQYQIEAMLGKGGMGAVYRARHILLGDRVAIKILPPEVRTNAEWLRRFRREGQAARRFRHPNSVTVYDLRTAADGMIYMVMEFVEGRTLSEEIKERGPMTPAQAFEILEPILSVLNTAHAMGVVHRDLKPENIMIGTTGSGERVVKLLDLGIAKMREIAGADAGGTTALTMAGQVLGTPYYMSPEQWGELPRDGDPDIDGRADLYSLGLVFYELIVGRRPYSGKTLHELRQEHISVSPPPLHEAVPGVSPAFSDAIARATAKDRGDRYGNAEELAAQLRAAVNASPMINLGRTVPDLPGVQESTAETSASRTAQGTKSNVDAPTLITVDSRDTAARFPSADVPEAVSAEVTSLPRTPPSSTANQASSGAGSQSVSPIDLSSSVTVPQAPRPQVESQPARRGPLMLAGAGALVLILLVAGVGGFFAFKWLTADTSASSSETANKNEAGNSGTTGTKELGRYWLELLPENLIGNSVPVAGVVPLASGQAFKFHFVFAEDGYLYIVGPGEGNEPTAFLTSRPAPISGLENNQVKKGADFSFPSGVEHWLQLDKKPGTEVYTIIFSSTPITSPAFLSTQPTGKPLTASEQSELSALLAAYQASKPLTELNDKNANERFVTVKVPKSQTASNPFVFEIRIEHKWSAASDPKR